MTTLSGGKVLDEINNLNQPPKDLTSVNVTFAPPAIDVAGDHNTRLTVTGNPGRGYYGSVDVFYNRAVLSESAPDAHLRSIQPFTKPLIISLLNNLYGLALSLEDLMDFTPPVLNLNEQATLTLTADPASLGWTGSMDVTFLYGRTHLSEIITVSILNTLTHPVDTRVGKQSLRMDTWGRDFTCLRDAIKPVAGTYTDFTTVQKACTYLGIALWEPGTIADHATSEIPDSNPLFDRVVIQSIAPSALGLGMVYLHYNLLDGV